MREIIARTVCFVTVALVLALAHLFAVRHNPPVREPGLVLAAAPSVAPAVAASLAAAAAVDSQDAARGRAVYEANGCASCHAIAGAGNPRNPLDGVGTRLSPAELRAWSTGTGAATEDLAPSVVRRKQRYQQLPESDLQALVAYLTTLKEAPRPGDERGSAKP